MALCRNCGAASEPSRMVVDGRWHCTACNTWQNEARCPTCGTKVARERIPPDRPGASFEERLSRLERVMLDDEEQEGEGP